jgi:hypothetical protein
LATLCEGGKLCAGQIPESVSRKQDAVGTDATDGFFYEVGTAVAVRKHEEGHGDSFRGKM